MSNCLTSIKNLFGCNRELEQLGKETKQSWLCDSVKELKSHKNYTTQDLLLDCIEARFSKQGAPNSRLAQLCTPRGMSHHACPRGMQKYLALLYIREMGEEAFLSGSDGQPHLLNVRECINWLRTNLADLAIKYRGGEIAEDIAAVLAQLENRYLENIEYIPAKTKANGDLIPSKVKLGKTEYNFSLEFDEVHDANNNYFNSPDSLRNGIKSSKYLAQTEKKWPAKPKLEAYNFEVGMCKLNYDPELNLINLTHHGREWQIVPWPNLERVENGIYELCDLISSKVGGSDPHADIAGYINNLSEISFKYLADNATSFKGLYRYVLSYDTREIKPPLPMNTDRCSPKLWVPIPKLTVPQEIVDKKATLKQERSVCKMQVREFGESQCKAKMELTTAEGEKVVQEHNYDKILTQLQQSWQQSLTMLQQSAEIAELLTTNKSWVSGFLSLAGRKDESLATRVEKYLKAERNWGVDNGISVKMLTDLKQIARLAEEKARRSNPANQKWLELAKQLTHVSEELTKQYAELDKISVNIEKLTAQIRIKNDLIKLYQVNIDNYTAKIEELQQDIKSQDNKLASYDYMFASYGVSHAARPAQDSELSKCARLALQEGEYDLAKFAIDKLYLQMMIRFQLLQQQAAGFTAQQAYNNNQELEKLIDAELNEERPDNKEYTELRKHAKIKNARYCKLVGEKDVALNPASPSLLSQNKPSEYPRILQAEVIENYMVNKANNRTEPIAVTH
jgi:hypothetical protein